ncbi:hypothetical protein CDAR_403011 [Caerostris darwini]|uniref:Uncharacterized protein n=1 Tax=Caerostris darwini TaxID=1538125 RepID=A0AAV4X3L9_9ARAC|nr:hypothetical protein CDAR_403011 [Caerostris darwini]
MRQKPTLFLSCRKGKKKREKQHIIPLCDTTVIPQSQCNFQRPLKLNYKLEWYLIRVLLFNVSPLIVVTRRSLNDPPTPPTSDPLSEEIPPPPWRRGCFGKSNTLSIAVNHWEGELSCCSLSVISRSRSRDFLPLPENEVIKNGQTARGNGPLTGLSTPITHKQQHFSIISDCCTEGTYRYACGVSLPPSLFSEPGPHASPCWLEARRSRGYALLIG